MTSVRQAVAPYLAVLVVAWWAVAAVAVLIEGRRLYFEGPEALVDANINDDGVELRQRAIVSGEWAPRGSVDGLALAPGRSGSVTLAVDKDPTSIVEAILWFYDGPARTALGCSRDGREFRTLASGQHLVGDRIDLFDCGRDAERIWLRFEATREGESTGNLQLVLDKILVQKVGVEPHLPDAPRWLSVGLLLGGLAGLVCLARGPAGVAVTFTSALVLIGWLWTGADPRWTVEGGSVPIDATGLVTAAILLVLWWWTVDHGQPAIRRMVRHLIALWVLGVSIAARWQPIDVQVMQPLTPDAAAVAALASQMLHPYDTSLVEPAWVWFAWLFDALVGPSWFSLRLFSLSASLGVLLASYAFVARYFGSVLPAILVMGLLGAHPFLIQSAGQGLRTELTVLVVIALAYVVFVPGLDRRVRAAGLAAVAGGVVVTQLSLIALVVVLLPYATWRHGLGPRVAVGGLTIAGVLLAPHLINNHRFSGDPLVSANVHAMYFRNHEFVRVRGSGCPGCPSLAEFEASPYSGAPTTVARYVFGMHRPSEVLTRTAKGYASLYVEPGPALHGSLGRSDSWSYASYVLGLAILLLTPWRELLLVPLLTSWTTAFLIPLGVDPRLAIAATPFMALAMVLPVWLGVRLIGRLGRSSWVAPHDGGLMRARSVPEGGTVP